MLRFDLRPLTSCLSTTGFDRAAGRHGVKLASIFAPSSASDRDAEDGTFVGDGDSLAIRRLLARGH